MTGFGGSGRMTVAALVVAATAAMPGFSSAVQGASPVVIGTVSTPATSAAGQTQLSRVLVIPFVTLNLSPDQQWMGKGVFESMVADLGKSASYSPVAFEGQTFVEDNATAARLAREAGAPYALRGAAQVVEGEVRLTAQIIDAKSGDTVSTAIATGPVNHLLKLEDSLAGQLFPTAALAAPTAPTAPLPPAYGSSGYVPPTYTPPANNVAPPVYPPDPLNDISLAAQNYNSDYEAPVYSAPVYSAPVYYQPSYCPTYLPAYCPPLVVGFGGGFNRGFRGGNFIHARSGFNFNRGNVGRVGGVHSVGGFHSVGGIRSGGGFHSGGGFSGGHGGRR